ncbi:MAG: head-tail connector protein [Methanoregulaceae archaeon]|nr:head-tail connector protein [Methanoregulaceae archaeon]
MSTAVYDRLTITLTEMKNYLRVSHEEDDELITDLVNSAKEDADNYLNNPFEDADGEELDIPSTVKRWVMGRVARMYERRIEGLSSEGISGLNTIAWGKEEYSGIQQYRINPGL